MEAKLRVGQELWRVRRGNGGQELDGRSVTVARVGRKYFEVDQPGEYPTEIARMKHGHDLSSGSTFYLSETHHDAAVAKRRAWRDFQEKVRRAHDAPKWLDAEGIGRLSTALDANHPQPADAPSREDAP